MRRPIRLPLLLVLLAVAAVIGAGLILLLPRAPAAVADSVPDGPAQVTRQALLDSGAALFRTCALCHGRDGRGERCPPVANADFVQGDRDRLIRVLLLGVTDTIRVNGTLWRGREMPALADALSDFEIAAVLTYIRSGLNDSLVVSCRPDDFETGMPASCDKRPRAAAEMAADTIAVHEVAAVRAAAGAPSPPARP